MVLILALPKKIPGSFFLELLLKMYQVPSPGLLTDRAEVVSFLTSEKGKHT